MKKKIKDNLIVCYTPLQVLIAEKIIESYPSESFIGILISFNDNEKYLFYYERLKSITAKSYYLNAKNYKVSDRVNMLIKIYFLSLKLNRKKYDRFFLASIDNAFVFLLYKLITCNQIITYDDGTANIFYNSSFYINKTRKSLGLIRKVLGVNESSKFFKDNSSLHYSIYSNRRNIISNTKHLKLLDENRLCSQVRTNNVSILLGQELFSDYARSEELINQIINKFQIDYFFPHPRQKNMKVVNESIESNLIFEDYLLDLVKRKPEVNIIVYSLISTAALNIMDIDAVENRIVFSIEVDQFYPKIYQLFKSFDLPFVDLD